VRQVCWISSTYYLPDEKAIPGQPGIVKRHIGYYQWVPVVLLAQALLFRVPCMFWRVFSDRSGININNLVEAAETIQNALYPERREKTIRYMIRHLDHYLDYQRDYRGGGNIHCFANRFGVTEARVERGNRRFSQSIIRARLHGDSSRMILVITAKRGWLARWCCWFAQASCYVV